MAKITLFYLSHKWGKWKNYNERDNHSLSRQKTMITGIKKCRITSDKRKDFLFILFIFVSLQKTYNQTR